MKRRSRRAIGQTRPVVTGTSMLNGRKEGTLAWCLAIWGNNWNDQALQSHMNYGLKSSPSHIIILQETMEELLEHLKAPGENGIPWEDGDATRGSGAKWQRRPTYQYIGFRGQETGSSLLICARTSIVKGMLLLLFKRRADGLYRPGRQKKERAKRDKKEKRMAWIRVLTVSLKMRFFKFADKTNELVIVNVHLHPATAKKDVEEGANSLKKFWDELVAYIIRFRARVLAGDFNMALWEVIHELRARGVHVHLAAWYPWQGPHGQHGRIDSVAIFIIGPVAGIHKMFDASALEIWDDGGGEVPREWKLAEEVIHDPAGGQQRRPYAVQEFDYIG